MFDDQAHGRSPQLWLATHKPLAAAAGAGAALAATQLARVARNHK